VSGRDADVASAPWNTARASEGETGRLGRLYEQHAPDAIRLAALLTGDRALAEDIVQEAFARLVGRLQHIREPEAFRAYLRKAVVNLSRMHFRRRKVERASLAKLGSRPAAVAGEPDVAVRESMAEALLGLPERQRAAIVLRFYEDLPERQVAEILRCRPGTVGSLVSRGLDALRPLMRDG
jgi:RNA polymerase sigma-70 factor (sigma-E family)